MAFSTVFAGSSSAAELRIGIIGAGSVGTTLAQLWIKSGHEVMLSSRHPDEITSRVHSLGPKAKVGTPEQAAQFGDIIVTAIPFGALPEVGKAEGKLFANKVVIDPSNPYPGRDGNIADKALKSSSGEVSAQALGNTHVVRAFNTIAMSNLASVSGRKDPIAIPVASDDQHAIEVASQLIREAGFAPVIAGGLKQSHLFDPDSDIFLSTMNVKQLESALHNHD